MQRQTLNISGYQYAIELYDSKYDLEDEQYSKKFVMLRNFSIANDIVCDKDIMFIDKSLYEEISTSISKDSKYTKLISFPVNGAKITGYSQYFADFNDNFTVKSIKNSDAYNIYGKKSYTDIIGRKRSEYYEKAIPCSKFKLYHPISKLSLDAIICIDNYINNIHFYYLCRPLSNYGTNSESEFVMNNQKYSEYIEIWFPNPNELFKREEEDSEEYAFYYKEDLDNVISSKNEKFITKITSNEVDQYYDSSIVGQYVPINLLIQPFRIVEEVIESGLDSSGVMQYETIFAKLYIKQQISIENNYVTYPINLSIYPYSNINTTTNLYILDDNLSLATSIFAIECKFSIASKLGFDNGMVSVVNTFNCPNQEYWEKLAKTSSTTSVSLAYKYYNDITDNEYGMFWVYTLADMYKKGDIKLSKYIKSLTNYITVLDSNNEATDEELKLYTIVDEYANDRSNTGYAYTILKAIKGDYTLKSLLGDEELEEELGTELNFLGFRIQIATDIAFKNIIYNYNRSLESLDDLDDFSFNITGIFKSWNELPNDLIAKVMFIDRFLDIEITGNFVVITKEWFKYMVNDISIYSVKKIQEANTDMKTITLGSSNINFINNIKCIVSKEDTTSSQQSSNVKSTKILYRPIFYKVQDLQSIKIRASLKQNIGINLTTYMTKVETFKIVIDGTEYVETGRNDVYVIFKIDATKITSTSGKYDITNQDDEYISSGSFTLV